MNNITFDPMETIKNTFESEMTKLQQKLQKWDDEHPISIPNLKDEKKFSIEEVRELLHKGLSLAEIREMEANMKAK